MIDVAVLSTPFLDLTFAGLEELPPLGGERFATDLIRSPGGGAITATGMARLGLSTALAAPLGDDPSGAFLAAALRADGVRLVAPHDGPTATTVVMPAHCDRAMVTFDPGVAVRRSDIEALAPRAVVCGVEQLDALPDGTDAFVSVGDQEAQRYAQRLPAALAGHTLIVNEAEALVLAGVDDAERAAHVLAGQAGTAVVTVGPRGAIAVSRGRALHRGRSRRRPGGRHDRRRRPLHRGLRLGRAARHAHHGKAALVRALRLAICHRSHCDRRCDQGIAADRRGGPARASRQRPEPPLRTLRR